MGIKLDISMETPLSDDDRDILAGISVMVLAIANRQNLVDQAEESAAEEEAALPTPCGSRSKDDPDLYCVSEVGHPGRHKFRPLPDPGERLN